MKNLLFCLIWMIPLLGIGQDTVWSRWGTFTAKPIQPHVTYYPVYGGKQLVEVDFFHFYNAMTRYENAVWEEKYGHSHLGGRDMPNLPNMFILRDEDGAILAKYYSTLEWNKHFKLSQLLPVQQAPVTHYKPVLDSIEANRNEYGVFPNRPRMRSPYFQIEHLGYVGVMDTLGNVVVKPNKYTYISSDEQYPIVVGNGGLLGILGPDWKALQEPTFQYLQPLSKSGVFVGCLEKCGIFTVNAEVLVPFEYVWRPEIRHVSELRCPPWSVPVQNDKGWGFISPDGLSKDWGFDLIEANEFGFMVQKGSDWAWFDCQGNRLTDFVYSNLPPENLEGSFFSLVKGGGDVDDYWGRKYHLVNGQGKVMVQGDFARIYSVGKGQVVGWLNDQMNLIDTLGWNLVHLPNFNYLNDLGELLAGEKSEKMVVINRAGKVVMKGPFKGVEKLDGRRIVTEDMEERFQVWNPSGELLSPLFFKRVEWDEEGWIWVMKDDYSHLLMDTLGNFVPNMVFGSHENFNQGTVIVSRYKETPSRYGVVDLNGNWVVPCKYEYFTSPNEFSPNNPYSVSDSVEQWVQQRDGSWKRFGK